MMLCSATLGKHGGLLHFVNLALARLMPAIMPDCGPPNSLSPEKKQRATRPSTTNCDLTRLLARANPKHYLQSTIPNFQRFIH